MDVAEAFQVRLEISLVEEFGAQDLCDHIGMRVGRHFGFVGFAV